MIRLLPLAVLLISTSLQAEDKSGSVCFGRNLAKPIDEHTDRLYIKIDDSEKLYFNHHQNGPVLSGLDLEVKHRVKVYFDDVLARSWVLDFKELKTNRVLIWRAAGSWRMEAADNEECM